MYDTVHRALINTLILRSTGLRNTSRLKASAVMHLSNPVSESKRALLSRDINTILVLYVHAGLTLRTYKSLMSTASTENFIQATATYVVLLWSPDRRPLL
jgi:hypothetical protein